MLRDSGEQAKDLGVLWGPILETLLVAGVPHTLPPTNPLAGAAKMTSFL